MLRAADAVIVPLIPTPLSVRMLAQLRDFLAEAMDDVALTALLLNEWTGVGPCIRGSTEAGRKEYPEMLRDRGAVLELSIERMSLRRAPIASYSPRSAVAQVYTGLWADIEQRLGEGAATAAKPSRTAGLKK